MIPDNSILDNSITRYRINQITDTGVNVDLALSEDVELESVSQQQLMIDAIDRALQDKEVKEQIKEILANPGPRSRLARRSVP